MPGNFQIETQEKSEWCWAAVAVSIEKYFNSKSDLTQDKVAEKVLGNKRNEPATLIKALNSVKRLSATLTSPLSLDLVRAELDAGRPVCARIKWSGGGAHFVVITGYQLLQSGARHVDVADPFNPNSTLAYDDFCNAYFGDGTWVDTYLVTNSAKYSAAPAQAAPAQAAPAQAAPAQAAPAQNIAPPQPVAPPQKEPTRVNKPAPPPQILAALKTGLSDFLQPSDPHAAFASQYHEAHEVFSLGLNQVKPEEEEENTDLRTKAKSVGWRFLAGGAKSDLGCQVGGTGPKLMGLTRTPEIHVILHRLRQMDDHIANPSGNWNFRHLEDYEMRALRIPGLLLEALWLHCPRDPQHDRVIPIAGFVANTEGQATWTLELMRPYLVNDFLNALKEAAAARRAGEVNTR
jgi:hypothetical protein